MVSSPLPSEKAYIEALAESYKIAGSWDTRGQILSITAGVASYKSACGFIPGLMSFRYTVASLHRVQYGSGAPLPFERQTRLRIERVQLDHFLSFITSRHLVQDLPFGERNLVLLMNETIRVPNLIRTMILQRVRKQYVSFYQETGIKTFSEKTMLRILSECAASVRKSLQGQYYFAADGSKAFEDLFEVVKGMPAVGLEQEWKHEVQDSLKAATMYLKGDYKVNYSLKTLCRIEDVFVSTCAPVKASDKNTKIYLYARANQLNRLCIYFKVKTLSLNIHANLHLNQCLCAVRLLFVLHSL